jgi:hypothetical protein
MVLTYAITAFARDPERRGHSPTCGAWGKTRQILARRRWRPRTDSRHGPFSVESVFSGVHRPRTVWSELLPHRGFSGSVLESGRFTTHPTGPHGHLPAPASYQCPNFTGPSEQPPVRLEATAHRCILAGQRRIIRRRPLQNQTREQRIQSAEAKLTLQHPKRNVSAGHRPALVGRVGLEPTADGL